MTFDLKKIVLFGLIGFLFPLNIFSQDTLHVNLSKALEIGLSESPTINIAERSVLIKKYYKKEQIVAFSLMFHSPEVITEPKKTGIWQW
jgi:hypothetical protein